MAFAVAFFRGLKSLYFLPLIFQQTVFLSSLNIFFCIFPIFFRSTIHLLYSEERKLRFCDVSNDTLQRPSTQVKDVIFC